MKKNYIVFITAILFACFIIGTEVYIYYKDIQQEIKSNQKEIKKLKKKNKEKDETIDTMKQSIDDLQKEIDSKDIEKEKLENELSEMLKQVSMDSQNVSQPSGATVYHMRKALKGTELYNLSNAFIKAEQETGVNAFFLLGIVALESGWGTSNRANDGSFNLTGHAVYDNASRGTQFSSAEECILVTARDIKNNYLTETGSYFNGYSIAAVNQKYCTSSDWKDKVAKIAYDSLWKANN